MITQKIRQDPKTALRDGMRIAVAFYHSRSFREKAWLFAMAGIVAALMMYKVCLTVSEAFQAQARRLNSATNMVLALPNNLATYAQLRARKDAVEKAYREVQVSEGMLTYLESLLKSEDSIIVPFSIEDAKPKRFAGDYEQMPFMVKFNITNYNQLIELLKDLVQGKKPMFIKSIAINKTAGGRQLKVDLDLTGVRRTQSRDAGEG